MKYFIRNFITVNIVTLFSKFSGIIRDFTIPIFLPPGVFADNFIAVLRTVFSARRMLGEGTFDSSVVSGLSYRDGAHVKYAIINYACMALCISLFCYIFIFIFAEYICTVIMPGMDITITPNMLRIAVLYFVFSSVAYALVGVLQFYNRFFVVAVMPVLFNVLFVVLLILCTTRPMLIVILPIIGIVQLMYALKCVIPYFRGVSFKFAVQNYIADALLLLSIILPIMSQGLIMFINSAVITHFISYRLYDTYIFYYVDRVVTIPIVFFGNLVSLIALPALVRSGSLQDLSSNFRYTFLFSFGCALPFSMFMIVNSELIMGLLGDICGFQNNQIQRAVFMFQIVCLSITPLTLNRITYALIIARGKLKLSTFISLFLCILNVLISGYFYDQYGLTGVLLLSTAMSFIYTIINFYISDLKFSYIFNINTAAIFFSVFIAYLVLISTQAMMIDMFVYNIFILIALFILSASGYFVVLGVYYVVYNKIKL